MQKKSLVVSLVLTVMAFATAPAWAQEQGAQHHAATEVIGAKALVQGPTYADVYCAGYITTQAPHELGWVSGNWNTPREVTSGNHRFVYLTGSGFEVGKEYELIRHVRDPNHARVFPGQKEAVRAAGEIYFEIGSVKVIEVRDKTAITEVVFACDGIRPGDLVVAMPQRTIPPPHGPMAFDRFAPANGKTTGRIIQATDNDWLIGNRSHVMLNIGADKGVKPGDYFRITRTYTDTATNELDRIPLGSRDMVDDSAVNPNRVTAYSMNSLPRRSLGELVVTEVTPKSATAMITFALEEMFLGDGVELIDVPPPLPPEAAPQPMAPSIACNAVPANVRMGDISNITCEGASPDNRPLTYAFASDRGQLAPHESNAILATRDAGAGPITVTATVTDDRNMSASTNVVVNVEGAAPAPQPSLAGEAMFKPSSAYVDNRAKAMLDGIALRMNQERDARAVVVGYSDAGENQSLAMRRANNVKTYLTKTKGVDAARIETRAGSTGGGKKAEVWIVPAGATMP
ncbi:MAG: OmpA family protein [Candidatus Koribacter versatilis]|uniref:OmpA family protein n=1 Tax=Candidatus Korobacter versatilis TaxID=658062 RepID=A0A932AAV6_9BACT|nr:OmpA family protein [Candidatus Koribacter versatilis]